MLHRESVPQHTLELLEKLSIPFSSMGFYLAGGTALALRLGHRVSVDLDFFKSGSFSVDEVVKLVEDCTEKVTIINKGEFSVSMIVDGSKVEFLRYDYPVIEKAEEVEGIVLSSFIDNALMKLSAITGRGAKKDFADIVAILKITSLEELMIHFQHKFSNTDHFVVLKSLAWFEDAEGDPDPEMLIDLDWVAIKQFILDVLDEL